jgi:hypothetical protein
MIRSSRRAAVILSGSAIALAGAVLPAQAATTGWRVDATYAMHGGSVILTGVDAVNARDAWAAGFEGKNSGTAAPHAIIRHWTGRQWNAVTLPARIARAWNKNSGFVTPMAASPRDVWLFGGFSGSYLRLQGSHWSIGKLPGSSQRSGAIVDITAATAFSGSNVWAFGERANFSGTQITTTPYAAHYNGHRWSIAAVPSPSPDSGTISGVSAVSARSIWAIEDTQSNPASTNPVAGPPVALHWTPGTGWQQPAQQPTLTAGEQLSSVAAEPNGDVWFGGSAPNTAKGSTPLAVEWNGTAWSVAGLAVPATRADWGLATISPDGTGGAWAIGQASNRNTEQLWHLHGTTWSRVTPAFGTRPWVLIALALVQHSHSLWAVGAIKHGGSADGMIAVDGPTPR